MGGATGLSQEQLVALARIAGLPQARAHHLVGGSAIAVHFGHRRSEDLDIFSIVPDVDLGAVRASLAASAPTFVLRYLSTPPRARGRRGIADNPLA